MTRERQYKMRQRPRSGRLPAGWAVLAAIVLSGPVVGTLTERSLCAQAEFDMASPAHIPPPPIFWKQSLFQIPYQWGSAAEPGAAQLVLLFVSKDQGVSWQKISEARPDVASFSYRADGEGEYWFAVRTLDRQGRAWPAGDFQPELRVTVDTTMPQITDLRAVPRADGSLEIAWSATDRYLDPSSWKIELQNEVNAPWQQVAIADLAGAGGAASTTNEPVSGRMLVRPLAGRAPVAVRATVLDRAGNSATFQTVIQSASNSVLASEQLPVTKATGTVLLTNPLTTNQPTNNPFAQAAPLPQAQSVSTTRGVLGAGESPSGWSPSPVAAAPTVPQAGQPADQPWPADSVARAPFRLWNGGLSSTNDDATVYGSPSGIVPPTVAESEPGSTAGSAGVSARYAASGEAHANSHPAQFSGATENRAFQPLAPFRQASIHSGHQPGENDWTSTSGVASGSDAAVDSAPSSDANWLLVPPNVRPRLVGSRTFALEYELDEVARPGVSKIELWGTHDRGRNWRCFTRDDDNRSPIVVTVDEEGLYGFRILVEEVGRTAPVAPTPGDEPELWVAVDLQRPVAELTAIEPGAGEMFDRLILRWRASDNNLEARPISLFYRSRPAGEWWPIVKNLENTGEYAWHVERHVPRRFYLRLEARDTAGNIAAFVTRDPVEFAPSSSNGRLRSAEPLEPTASGAGASYR